MKIIFSKSGNKKSASHSVELTAFQNDNESAISRLYDAYRGGFITFAVRNFHVDNDTAADIYQESFIALYQNIRNGKLTNLSVSLKTYLFKIGKYKLMNHNRSQNVRCEEGLNEYLFNMLHCDSPDWVRKQEITYQVVLQMLEPCSTVLMLCYWEGQSMLEIAKRMKYKSEQVAINRKSLCIKKLRKYLIKVFESEGLTVKTNNDEKEI